MYGMHMMSDSVSPLADMPQFQQLLVAFDNPLMGLLIGTAFTGIIQSSAASIGVLQALSLTGSISFGMAAPIVMGANIGTCVTAILSGIGVSKNAKRVPAIHIGIKIVGTVIWMIIYFVARYVLGLTLFDNTISAFQIAVFHTIFNIGTILVLLPFQKKIADMAVKFLPVEDEKEDETVLLDDRLLVTPGFAVNQCRDRTAQMAAMARDSFRRSLNMVYDYNDKDEQRITKIESKLDEMEDALNIYLVKVSSLELADVDSFAVSEMMHSVTDFERIGDHAMNMVYVARDMKENKLSFSESARAELDILTSAVNEILDITVEIFKDGDEKGAGLVEPLEQVIDELVMEIKDRHISRLRKGSCKAELGPVLNDLLTNCERVSDHCSNVAMSVIQARLELADSHEYLNDIKHGNTPEFKTCYKSYEEKYRLPLRPSQAKE